MIVPSTGVAEFTTLLAEVLAEQAPLLNLFSPALLPSNTLSTLILTTMSVKSKKSHRKSTRSIHLPTQVRQERENRNPSGSFIILAMARRMGMAR